MSSELLRSALIDLVAEEAMLDKERLTEDATMEHINMASYDMVMVLMAIEEKHGVYISVDTDLSEAKTFGALLDVLVRRIEAHKSAAAVTEAAPMAGQSPDSP